MKLNEIKSESDPMNQNKSKSKTTQITPKKTMKKNQNKHLLFSNCSVNQTKTTQNKKLTKFCSLELSRVWGGFG